MPEQVQQLMQVLLRFRLVISAKRCNEEPEVIPEDFLKLSLRRAV